MDPRVAGLDAKSKRATEAMLIVVVSGVTYFFVAIFVLSQFGAILGGWATAVFLPIPVSGIAVFVLRTRATWLRSDAALAQVRATYESLDALEREIEESERTGDGGRDS